MCYVIYLSTTSNEDLGAIASDRLQFVPVGEDDDARILAVLAYPFRWNLTCKFGGCSCHFRHDDSVSNWTGERVVSFEPPQDWCPEDADDVEASMAAREEFNRIVSAGHALDVIDVWNGTPPENVKLLNICIGEIQSDHFRFFPGYKFNVL